MKRFAHTAIFTALTSVYVAYVAFRAEGMPVPVNPFVALSGALVIGVVCDVLEYINEYRRNTIA